MKKIVLVLKYFIYYIIGLIVFSLIAYITQTIMISILVDKPIYVTQDVQNILNIILSYYKYYIPTYTMLYFLILFCVRKYDRYVVNKLNKILKEGENNNEKR